MNTERQGTVIDLSSDGWGVVRDTTGQVTFVPGAWPGDEISFEIVREGKFNLGKIISWQKKSDAHRESPCAHWGLEEGKCGACAWMGIHYADQLRAKEKRLASILRKFKIEAEEILPIQASVEFGYRNRVKLSTDGKNLGFFNPLTNKVAAIEKCLVVEDWINEEFSTLSKSGLNQKEYWLPSEGTFAQGNTSQNEKMKEHLAALLDVEYNSALELFCGDGNFSSVLVTKTKELNAYESSAEAIRKLKVALPQVKAKVKDLYSKHSLAEIAKENSRAELLFLDPPRSGYKDFAKLCESLKNLKAIIYLSCDPMTFARDVSQLKNWKLKKLAPFDLFPQTPHLEVMAYFSH
jgi:23S rRNA (uracil1939-C5)-methyltransferase